MAAQPKTPQLSALGQPKRGDAVPDGLLEQLRALQNTQASQNAQQAPLQHQMTVNALGKAILELAAQAGGMATQPGTALVNCDLLRRLDTKPQECPQWLRNANRKADIELTKWYVERGFAFPNDETDPGEPTNGQDSIESLMAFERPDPQTQTERLVEYLKCRRSVVYFVDNYCMLEDENRGIIPFRLWRWQAWMLCRWQQHALTINLKARQIGVSECACGTSEWLTRFYDTKTTIVISKSDDDAQALLGRVKVMADYLPEWLQPGIDGRLNEAGIDSAILAKTNTQEYIIDHQDARGRPHYSSILSMAATKGAGRGRTAALVILDEMAHMIWGGDIWDSVKYTAGRGKIICISTALGMNNVYHRLWLGAADGQRNGFYPIFLGWNRHPERDQDWYARQKAEAEANNELPKLHQECPGDPTEAFIQSGLPVFDQNYITRHAQRIREEIAERKGLGLPDWVEIDGLTIFEEPIPGHQYIVGADTAGGGIDGDWDDASVVDRNTGYEVAALHGKWPHDVYAAKLDSLGHQFNNALLAVERNNTYGGYVLAELLSGKAHAPANEGKHLPYPNLYHAKPDLVPGHRQDARPGWQTTLVTKPMMIGSTQTALREDAYHPRSLKALDEMVIFSYDETGLKTGAPKGSHDDRVISRCISVHILCTPDYVQHALTMVRSLRSTAQSRAQNRRATTAPPRSDRPQLVPGIAPMPVPPIPAASIVA
jgi:hypothetical protein